VGNARGAFYARPSASQAGEEAGGGGGSLFSASLCLPFHCCWRRFLVPLCDA